MFTSSSAASAASVSSPRLRDVLATLNVAGAAPLARRDGGVGNDVLERDTEEFGDTYSGTSLDSFVVSVPAQLSSQDYMVLEDKEYSSSSLIRNRSSVPREPRPYLTSLNAGPAKTFSLKLLPNEIGDLARICRTTIGKGGQVRDWVPKTMAFKRGKRIRKGPGMPCVDEGSTLDTDVSKGE